MRGHVRGALLAGSLLAGISAALAQSGEPPSSAPSAAPATSTGPQQATPQRAPQPTLPPQPSPPSAAAAQAPAEKRGFFDDLSSWWHDSVADFNAKLKEQQSKIDDFNKKSAEAAKDAATATQQAMKNAADAVVKSATSKVIEIHACGHEPSLMADVPMPAEVANFARMYGLYGRKTPGPFVFDIDIPEEYLRVG